MSLLMFSDEQTANPFEVFFLTSSFAFQISRISPAYLRKRCRFGQNLTLIFHEGCLSGENSKGTPPTLSNHTHARLSKKRKNDTAKKLFRINTLLSFIQNNPTVCVYTPLVTHREELVLN